MSKWDSERCFSLPPCLSERGFTLRSEDKGDREFLEKLYIAVRWPELEQCDWTDQARLEFLRDQFGFQDKHYAEHYSDAEFLVLERNDAPLGRLYLFRAAKDIRIVDISLLPETRNTGVGTALLQGVMDEAKTTQRTVSIHVEKFNPAQRLYRRLGFVEIGENGPYWLMEWTA